MKARFKTLACAPSVLKAKMRGRRRPRAKSLFGRLMPRAFAPGLLRG